MLKGARVPASVLWFLMKWAEIPRETKTNPVNRGGRVLPARTRASRGRGHRAWWQPLTPVFSDLNGIWKPRWSIRWFFLWEFEAPCCFHRQYLFDFHDGSLKGRLSLYLHLQSKEIGPRLVTEFAQHCAPKMERLSTDVSASRCVSFASGAQVPGSIAYWQAQPETPVLSPLYSFCVPRDLVCKNMVLDQCIF